MLARNVKSRLCLNCLQTVLPVSVFCCEQTQLIATLMGPENNKHFEMVMMHKFVEVLDMIIL